MARKSKRKGEEWRGLVLQDEAMVGARGVLAKPVAQESSSRIKGEVRVPSETQNFQAETRPRNFPTSRNKEIWGWEPVQLPGDQWRELGARGTRI